MALTRYFGRLPRKVENGRSLLNIIDITRSNQSLERTATRFAFTFCVTKILSFRATRALGRPSLSSFSLGACIHTTSVIHTMSSATYAARDINNALNTVERDIKAANSLRRF